MGAKLHPSPRVYRVYAPSTHSLPVIKCVAGVEGEAEIEIKSCHSGIYGLRDLSPLYQRIWNSRNTSADKLTLKNAPSDHRRTFSVVSSLAVCLHDQHSNLASAVYLCRGFSETTSETAPYGEAMELFNQASLPAWRTTTGISMRSQSIWEIHIQSLPLEPPPQPSTTNRGCLQQYRRGCFSRS